MLSCIREGNGLVLTPTGTLARTRGVLIDKKVHRYLSMQYTHEGTTD